VKIKNIPGNKIGNTIVCTAESREQRLVPLNNCRRDRAILAGGFHQYYSLLQLIDIFSIITAILHSTT
jgi:hypothetical protein